LGIGNRPLESTTANEFSIAVNFGSSWFRGMDGVLPFLPHAGEIEGSEDFAVFVSADSRYPCFNDKY
jgi:hypothetical protein